MKVVFLDTETTGPNFDEGDRMVQLAYRVKGGETVNELFNPGKPISYEAMAVHHITQKMIEDKPNFKDSPDYNKLQGVLDSHIMVAHNAPFDAGFLKVEGVNPEWVIDSYKVAYKLLEQDQDGNPLSGHSLQYLRYALDLNAEGATAHDALGDIIILENLFELLFSKMTEQMPEKQEKDILAEMINISNQPLVLRKLMFGKHYGKTFQQVISEAPDYLKWLASKDDLDENLVHTLKHHNFL